MRTSLKNFLFNFWVVFRFILLLLIIFISFVCYYERHTKDYKNLDLESTPVTVTVLSIDKSRSKVSKDLYEYSIKYELYCKELDIKKSDELNVKSSTPPEIWEYSKSDKINGWLDTWSTKDGEIIYQTFRLNDK